MDDDDDFEYQDDLTAFLETEAEETSADYAEHEYWDRFLADEAQTEYDDEWGDPLDLPSYAD
ncbi:hypothetical protein SEA_CECE_326 [Microbacterium phage Cece]|nr:hypothetical protein SEA_CECE_24 [Microbacterium phage Cece]UVG35332.1 hypothetical protein SEA_CECE_326 [Microbacterium phage Cece]